MKKKRRVWDDNPHVRVAIFIVVWCIVMVFFFWTKDGEAADNDYTFTYDRVFYSSDRGITVKFYVEPVGGSRLIPQGSKDYGSAYMPTYATMRVDGKLHSRGPVSVLDEPRPYVLYDDFSEEEYRSIGVEMAEGSSR